MKDGGQKGSVAIPALRIHICAFQHECLGYLYRIVFIVGGFMKWCPAELIFFLCKSRILLEKGLNLFEIAISHRSEDCLILTFGERYFRSLLRGGQGAIYDYA